MKTARTPQLNVQCPRCRKLSRVGIEDFPQVKGFASMNYRCTHCLLWVQLDMFAQASHLNVLLELNDEDA